MKVTLAILGFVPRAYYGKISMNIIFFLTKKFLNIIRLGNMKSPCSSLPPNG
jgi:hypothetical protein